MFNSNREICGYELLFRAPGRHRLRVDLWNARQQDRATEHVLAAAFFSSNDNHIGEGLPVFVNVTRTYLLDRTSYLHDPREMVVEVVESAYADLALSERLRELKDLGYRIAVDDFVGTRSQRDLLDLADYVKIDLRDLDARGPALIEAARGSGAILVAERIETPDEFQMCVDHGFTLFQGHHLEAAEVVERGLA